MTGQVKEDVLCRFGEIGAFVKDGKLQFNPKLLRKEELLTDSKDFIYIDLEGSKKTLTLAPNTFSFTYCQIPVIYQLSDKNAIDVFFKDDSKKEIDSLQLDTETSKKIFQRTGEVEKIIVFINK